MSRAREVMAAITPEDRWATAGMVLFCVAIDLLLIAFGAK